MTTFNKYLEVRQDLMAPVAVNEDSTTTQHNSYDAASQHHRDQEKHYTSQGFHKTFSKHQKAHGGGNSYHGRKTTYKHPDGREVNVHTKSTTPHSNAAPTHTTVTHNKGSK